MCYSRGFAGKSRKFQTNIGKHETARGNFKPSQAEEHPGYFINIMTHTGGKVSGAIQGTRTKCTHEHKVGDQLIVDPPAPPVFKGGGRVLKTAMVAERQPKWLKLETSCGYRHAFVNEYVVNPPSLRAVCVIGQSNQTMGKRPKGKIDSCAFDN